MLLQMIVGAWPLDLAAGDDKGRNEFAGRLAGWQQKALREAKLATDWSVPNECYESAGRDLLMGLVARNQLPAVLEEIVAFADRIAPAGAMNGLAQTLLKLTAPGIPDLYQGTEFWDFSLVDPDNRRPVDFAARIASLRDTPSDQLMQNWRDGHIKQALITRTLALRRARPQLFAEGSYEPVEVHGMFADRIVAFSRRSGSDVAITVVPRAASKLLQEGTIAFAPDAWADTSIALQGITALHNVLDGQAVATSEQKIETLLAGWPIALLVSRID